MDMSIIGCSGSTFEDYKLLGADHDKTFEAQAPSTTKKKSQQHQKLATEYFKYKFSNRLVTYYIYFNFLMLATNLAT